MVTNSEAYCSTQERQPISQLIKATNTQESMVWETIMGGYVWSWMHCGGWATTVVDGKLERQERAAWEQVGGARHLTLDAPVGLISFSHNEEVDVLKVEALDPHDELDHTGVLNGGEASHPSSSLLPWAKITNFKITNFVYFIFSFKILLVF